MQASGSTVRQGTNAKDDGEPVLKLPEVENIEEEKEPVLNKHLSQPVESYSKIVVNPVSTASQKYRESRKGSLGPFSFDGKLINSK